MSPNDAGAGNQILIRGDAAARAQAIDLVRQTAGSAVGAAAAVSPWTADLEQEREAAREAGFEQGRNEGMTLGLQEGREQMQQQMDQRLADLAATLDNVLAEIDERSHELCQGLASQVSELALEIAEAVLGHEVAAATDPGAEAIARCLEMAPVSGDVVAQLHPADLAQLGEVTAMANRKLSITADPTLKRGDAIVTVEDATIDGRLSESLRRVGEALR